MACIETRNRVASRKSHESMASSENIGRYRFELDTGCGSEYSDDLNCDMTTPGR